MVITGNRSSKTSKTHPPSHTSSVVLGEVVRYVVKGGIKDDN